MNAYTFRKIHIGFQSAAWKLCVKNVSTLAQPTQLLPGRKLIRANMCRTMCHDCAQFASTHSPEVHAGRPLVDVRLPDAPDAALGEEYADERRIVATRPLFDRERQRVGEIVGRIGKLQEAVHRDARVVESETEERQLKVEVLVQLRHRRMDVRLVVAVVVVAALIEEPVQEVAPQLRQTCRTERIAAAVVAMAGRLGGCNTVVRICDEMKPMSGWKVGGCV